MFSTRWDDANRTLAVQGEIDASTAHRFREAILGVAREAAPVRLDLRDVTFMDSTAVGAMLDAAEELGDRFMLGEVNERVRRLFLILGLDEVFPELQGGSS
ncbi:MAG: STAS domain-containing protein [Clostridia bacterium]|nr:STAS domain-containing protein [Clostridia bacterium]